MFAVSYDPNQGCLVRSKAMTAPSSDSRMKPLILDIDTLTNYKSFFGDSQCLIDLRAAVKSYQKAPSQGTLTHLETQLDSWRTGKTGEYNRRNGYEIRMAIEALRPAPARDTRPVTPVNSNMAGPEVGLVERQEDRRYTLYSVFKRIKLNVNPGTPSGDFLKAVDDLYDKYRHNSLPKNWGIQVKGATGLMQAQWTFDDISVACSKVFDKHSLWAKSDSGKASELKPEVDSFLLKLTQDLGVPPIVLK
jgi:hypothetical protein